MPKSTRVSLSAISLITILLSISWGSLVYAQETSPPLFTDVIRESPFFVPLDYLKKRGIVTPYADGSFRPEQPLRRIDALALILAMNEKKGETSDEGQQISVTSATRLRLATPTIITVENVLTGEKTDIHNVDTLNVQLDGGSAAIVIPSEKKERPFRDISLKSSYLDIAQEAKDRGLVQGVEKKGKTERYLYPQGRINLAEALRILFKAHAVDSSSIGLDTLPVQIDPDSWFASDLAYAISRGIVMRQANGATFSPERTLSRGEMSILMYRFLRSNEGAAFGYASWYGDGLAKTKLTNNAEYAQRFLTAAHRTFPFGTILRVRNVANGKTVDVVVNDRGPFVTGRVIDLSKTAFSALESPSAGVAAVEIQPLEMSATE